MLNDKTKQNILIKHFILKIIYTLNAMHVHASGISILFVLEIVPLIVNHPVNIAEP